jgi:hypothetical protein
MSPLPAALYLGEKCVWGEALTVHRPITPLLVSL